MLERFGREWHVPTVEVGGDGIVFTHSSGLAVIFEPRNTFLRIFGEGNDNPCNQVVYSMPSEQIVVFALNDKSMERLAIKERLLNGGYPVYHQPEPDEIALRWFADIVKLERQDDSEA